MSRAGNSVDRMFDAIRTPAWGYSPGNYGFNSYQRTDLTLQTLESLLGAETMARVMRTYHERWRFRHPTSDDFYAVVAEVAGRDRARFFEQTVERPGILDDEVASVRSERVREPRGVFGEGEAKTTVTTKEARKKEREADKAGGRPWRSTIVVRRRGEVSAADVAVGSSSRAGSRRRCRSRSATSRARGRRRRRSWTAARTGRPWLGRWKRIELTGERRLVSATVDPENRLAIDVNRLNNSRRVEPDGRAAAHWGARWVFWLQQLLAMVGL